MQLKKAVLSQQTIMRNGQGAVNAALAKALKLSQF
jgi:hypothetical protein